MFEFFKNKKSKNTSTPSEFLKNATVFLHEKAASKGYASKGFILNEELLEIGNPIISAALASNRNVADRPDYFYLEIATSILQTGVTLGRQCGFNKQSLSDGTFFDKHEDMESMYKELVIALSTDLHRSVCEWNEFREYIVPFWMQLIDGYRHNPDFEIYNTKLLAAYYMLGVSIGIEKYEI